MTGKNPGRHGVMGFKEYDAGTGAVRLTNSQSIRSETIWEKLSRHGRGVLSIGVPMTYPVLQVNGIMVSGFDTPDIGSQFTYPASFREEVLANVSDFTFGRRYRTGQLKDAGTFGDYIRWLRRQADQLVEILEMGMRQGSWDVAMVVIRSFDELLHHFWKLLDFAHDTSSDPRDGEMEGYFRDLDEVIGRLLEIAEKNGASVLLISDHGGQAKRGRIYPNRLLRQLGYIKAGSGWGSVLRGLRRRRMKRGRDRSHPLGKAGEPNAIMGEMDLGRTRACVTELNMYADLCVQVKGRQPHGTVRLEEVDGLVEAMAGELAAARDEEGKPLFEFVARPRTLYGVDDVPAGPDLIIAPREGYLMRMPVRGKKLITEAQAGELGGTHSINGMFGAMGEAFERGGEVNADILDVAPTVLAALGLPVTDDMDGKVIEEVFAAPPAVRYEAGREQETGGGHQYSPEEEREIAERLADLGYV